MRTQLHLSHAWLAAEGTVWLHGCCRASQASVCCAGGPVLITGGTGALGALMGSWALVHHPASVELLGRTGRFSGSPGLLASSLGCVSVRSCDIAAHADAAGLQGTGRCRYATALHAGELESTICSSCVPSS